MNFLRGQSVHKHMHSFIICCKHLFTVIRSMLVCCLTNTITSTFQQHGQIFIPRQSKNCKMQMQKANKQACIQVSLVLQYFFIALMTSMITIWMC
jgi:hypothetical protein